MKNFVLIIIITLGLSIFANGEIERDSNNKSISTSGIESFYIFTSSSDIEVISEDREDISLDLKSYKNGPELFVKKGKELKVEVKKRTFSFFTIYRGNVKLTIRIPKNYNKEISIESSSGDVKITNIELNNLDINLSSGDLTMNNIKSENINLETSSGDMKLDNILTEYINVILSSGDLKLNLNNGNFKGRLSSGDAFIKVKEISGDIDLSLSSGDANIELMTNDLSADFNLKTSSGDIEVDFPVLVSGKQKRNSFVGVVGTGKYSIKVSNSSGDITIY